ncbi:MAG: tetratricopeptide repeat protein, partial [Acidobacteriota bacterium]
MKRNSILLLVIAALVAACAAPPPPVVTPRGEDAFLVDPRVGYDRAPAVPRAADDLEAAWRFFLAGDYERAHLRLVELRKRDAHYPPADLVDAAIAMRQGRLSEARTLLENVPSYTAANVFRAELAYQEHDTRRALTLYRDVLRSPGAPATAATRVAELEKTLFDQIYHDALAASDSDAIPLLREALLLQPGARDARVLLAQKLVAVKHFDEARRELEPLLAGGDADRTDVQQALAEIDAGHGRFQEAIVRYDRLAHREHDPKYTRRVDE